MHEKNNSLAFDLSDELAQLGDLTQTLVATLSQPVLEYEQTLKTDSGDKLKNKLKAFRFNTIEAMTEMIIQIKSKGLDMKR